VLVASSLPAAPPQIRSSQTRQQKYERHEFEKHERIYVTVGRMKRNYFVGEPVEIPVVLTNHSRHKIHAVTNFIPRANLSIHIRPYGRPERVHYGPYKPGRYPPTDYMLLPFDDVTVSTLIWGDPDQASDLAFPEPGRYIIRMELRLDIPEAGIRGAAYEIPPIEIEVEPTPDQLRALIDRLSQDRGFSDLQVRQLPDGWDEDQFELMKKHSPCPLTPYMFYAAANYLNLQWRQDRLNDDLANEALYYYQVAAGSDSAYRFEIYMDLIDLMDELGMSKAAVQTSLEMLDKINPDYLGRLGGSETLQKYLINTRELDPMRDWSLLP
jgi:hypothetical protein